MSDGSIGGGSRSSVGASFDRPLPNNEGPRLDKATIGQKAFESADTASPEQRKETPTSLFDRSKSPVFTDFKKSSSEPEKRISEALKGGRSETPSKPERNVKDIPFFEHSVRYMMNPGANPSQPNPNGPLLSRADAVKAVIEIVETFEKRGDNTLTAGIRLNRLVEGKMRDAAAKLSLPPHDVVQAPKKQVAQDEAISETASEIVPALHMQLKQEAELKDDAAFDEFLAELNDGIAKADQEFRDFWTSDI